MIQNKSGNTPFLSGINRKQCTIALIVLFCIVLQSIAVAKITLVIVGDSVTRRSPRGGESFVTLLAELLGSEYDVRNFGVDGTTMVRGKAQYITYAKEKFDSLFIMKPDIITVMLGTNDAKPGIWKRSGEFYEEDAETMVDSLLTITPKPRLMLAFPPKAFKNRYGISDSALSKEQTPILRAIAEDAGIETIDVNTPTDSSLYFADGVHLSIEGTELLAKIYFECISKKTANSILLWPDGAPDALANTNSDKPALFTYPVGGTSKSPAVVVCPGGGYDHLSMNHEGHDVAKWLNSQGFSAFVLRYRCKPYKHPVPLNDAMRAMRMVRHLAGQYSLDTNRIGVLGFSAGGHLASTLMTHFDDGDLHHPDSIEHIKSRPDFGILIYPVISFVGDFVHAGSRDNLLGLSHSPDLDLNLSNQLQVTQNTPPAFLAHGDSDTDVPPANSRLFDSALTANGVSSQLFIDQGKAHGYGLKGKWPDACAQWLKNLEQFIHVRPQPRRPDILPAVRAVVQLGTSLETGLPARNSVYYILQVNDKTTGKTREKIFLPNGKNVLNSNSPVGVQ